VKLFLFDTLRIRKDRLGMSLLKPVLRQEESPGLIARAGSMQRSF
jgi:hypothetical protein